MNTEEFRKYGKDMIDYICNYFDNIEQRNVAPSVEPGYLKCLIPNEAPPDGEKFDKIIQDVEDKIMPGILHWNHPNFFGYYPAGRSFPSILGDMLSSCIGAFGFSWSSNPAFTELESIVLDWYARALNLPKAFLNDFPGGCGGGLLQSSAAECIFICMMAARYRVIHQLKGDNNERHDSEFLPHLVAYTSKDAHSCIEKVAKMTLVKIRIIDTDAHGRINVELLRQAIQNDLNAGLKPFFVAATAGTTSACAFDDFTEIGKICSETPDIWFHIDGAYGGNSFILPEMRQFSRGLEYADSLNVNPYKLLLVNLDASAMWVKDVMALKAALGVDPIYLNHGCKEEFAFCQKDIVLGRRFRALKLWFVFRTYGISGLQTHIRNHIMLAKKFESFVQRNAEFEVCNDVHLGLVCFRLKADDALNQKLLNQINTSAKIYLTPSIINGKYTLRFCLNYQFATYQHIVNAWKYIKTFANDILRREHMEWLEETPTIPEELDVDNDEYIEDKLDSQHIPDSERGSKFIVDSYTTMQSFFQDH